MRQLMKVFHRSMGRSINWPVVDRSKDCRSFDRSFASLLARTLARSLARLIDRSIAFSIVRSASTLGAREDLPVQQKYVALIDRRPATTPVTAKKVVAKSQQDAR